MTLFISGVMLGLKLAQVTALPAMWGKLSKWRSRAQPLCEAADPEGTELLQAPADTTDARFTAEEYVTSLLKIEADILALAAKAGPRRTAEKMQLHKLAHKIAMLAANAKASSAKPDPNPDVPTTGPASDLIGEAEPNVTRASSRHRGRSGWLRSISNPLGRSNQDEASAIAAVVTATQPVELRRHTDRATTIRRQHSALIVHEAPEL
jgi:hypothetical protein